MIKKFNIILILALTLCGNIIAFAATLRIEVKVFNDNVAFILYHERDKSLNIKAQGKLVSINTDVEEQVSVLNPSLFERYATAPQLSADKKHITFSTREEYKDYTVINGEKLTAIKFRHALPQETQQNSLPSASTQVNDITNVVNKDLSLTQIKYKTVKGQYILSFPFENAKDVKMAAFFRGKILWVVFSTLKNFDFAPNEIFTHFTQLPHKDHTILQIKTSNYVTAYVTKNNRMWEIIITSSNTKNPSKSLEVQPVENHTGVNIEGDFTNSTIIETEDDIIGDTLKIVTFNDPGININRVSKFVDFEIIPSVQGVIMTISSDALSFTKKDNVLQIMSQHSVDDNSLSDSTKLNLVTDINNTLLPVLLENSSVHFLTMYRKLIYEMGLAEDKVAHFDKAIELAEFFFANELYQESVAMLERARKIDEDRYNNDLKIQFVTAVGYTLIGRLGDATTIYTTLLTKVNKDSSHEILLWNNYNEFLFGKNPKEIGFLDEINRFIKQYPDDLYWPLALAAVDLKLLTNSLKGAEAIFRELRTPSAGKNSNSLQYYKAEYYKRKKQTTLAKQLWQNLIENQTDLFNITRAEMSLVKLQLANKEIGLPVAISRLQNVRWIWRGDTLEYDLLLQLATYYRDIQDSINALRTYMYAFNAFNNQISNFYITAEMVKIFNKIFSPGEAIETMDPFEAVSLFYEFKSLSPVGVQGDEITLSITKKLIQLDLLQQAVELLRHQVNYRLSGEKRIISADHLAIVLLMDDKPDEAIKVLNETDKDNTNFVEHQYRVRLKAKALIDKHQFTNALEYLSNDSSSDAEILKKECLFRAEKWREYINLVAPKFSITTQASSELDEAKTQDVLRLAIAYYMVNDRATLTNLAKTFAKYNKSLKTTLDLLLISGEPVDYKNLDQSLSIDQMQMLLDKYKNQIFNPYSSS